MAGLRIDHQRRCVEIDLHGYGASLARRGGAGEDSRGLGNGFERIIMVHGRWLLDGRRRLGAAGMG